MANIGSQTVKFNKDISIAGTSSVVGPKEGQGPLAKYFDVVLEDIMAGEKTWEKAESQISKKALDLATRKSGISMQSIDYVLAGDLLNQSTGSIFGIRDFNRPYVGIFGACSAMGLGMGLGAIMLEGGFAKNILIGASSHFCAAEKQFRYPLELGSQRPPTSTTTVTGCGAAVLTQDEIGPKIRSITTGKMVDMGITDANNMGAAMAPAAVDTLVTHFKDLNIDASNYDLIATGDLGYIGHEIVLDLMKKEGYDLSKNYVDCGILIYDKEKQDTHSGGSGCACSGVTFAAYLYQKLIKSEIKSLLYIPTGALMSPLSVQQKESIPGIAHAVSIQI